MTVAERINAATFIQQSTVRPFIFMGSSFKCFFCCKYYSDVTELLNHTSTHKITDRHVIFEKYVPKGKRTLQVDISELKCRICGEYYPNLDKIRNHLAIEHKEVFTQASNGLIEFNLKVVDGMFTCHVCYKKFHNFSLLNSHMNLHFGKVVCENCGECFQNQLLLISHKETHLKRRFECEKCEKVFYKRSQLKYHNNITHKGNRIALKKCPKCPETFKEHYSKMVHLKNVHGIFQNFQCHLCKTEHSTRRSLTEHSTRFHTEKYKCETCDKCFSIESKLKLHLRSHTGERNFICNICQNAYMHNTTLSRHMRTHKFACAECSLNFPNKNEYAKHKEWHASYSKKCLETIE